MADGVTIARPLIANNDLLDRFRRGEDVPPRPCTFCNRCLVEALENPLGCYEPKRFDSELEMLDQVLSVYRPQPFSG
jgi:2,4-dienoyl-CoA reductase (NADPH2)